MLPDDVVIFIALLGLACIVTQFFYYRSKTKSLQTQNRMLCDQIRKHKDEYATLLACYETVKASDKTEELEKIKRQVQSTEELNASIAKDQAQKISAMAKAIVEKDKTIGGLNNRIASLEKQPAPGMSRKDIKKLEQYNDWFKHASKYWVDGLKKNATKNMEECNG